MTKRTLVVLSLLATLGFTATAALPAEATGPALHFSYAVPNSPGSDYGSNTSLNNEWVRIRNSSSIYTYALTGYTVRDKSGHVYTFGTFKLAPGASVTLHSGKGTNTSTNRYWGSGWYIWNNAGDTAYLRKSTGVTTDYCSWGSVSNGQLVTC